MTRSADPRALDTHEMAIDEHWRERARVAQEQALPRGRAVVSCPAPLDSGGLGRHLRELLEALERAGEPGACICRPGASRAPAAGELRLSYGPLWRAARPLTRFSRAWRVWAESADFDLAAARRLPAADHLLAFNGAALAQLRASRRGRFETASVVSANSHYRTVIRQHERAHRAYPIERPWVRHLLRRNLAEYDRADRIYVSSEYIRDSFLREGHPDSLLERFPLTPDPRFTAAGPREESSSFEVVYIGSLTVHKGIPLLIDALGRLPGEDLRLVLVGGWATRAMRRYLQAACARDRRITIAPGDPLAHLRRARLCVHPAYEDGFAYAPAEALACGVPVIVSEDTGMKELIEPGRTGLITPTGDLGRLTEALAAACRGEILGV